MMTVTKTNYSMTMTIAGIEREMTVVQEMTVGPNLEKDMARRGFQGVHRVAEWTNKKGRKVTSLLWLTLDGQWTV